MAIPIEDISALAAYVHEEHGAKADHRINTYIDHFRRHGDFQCVELWLKVFAVRHQYDRR